MPVVNRRRIEVRRPALPVVNRGRIEVRRPALPVVNIGGDYRSGGQPCML